MIMYWLLHHEHFAGQGLASYLQFVEVDTGANAIAVIIFAVPNQAMVSACHITIQKSSHDLSSEV